MKVLFRTQGWVTDAHVDATSPTFKCEYSMLAKPSEFVAHQFSQPAVSLDRHIQFVSSGLTIFTSSSGS